MNSENKKLIISLIIIILFAVLIIGFINLRKGEKRNNSDRNADSNIEGYNAGLSQENINSFAERNNAASEINKTEDIKEKLGFEPKIPEVLSDGLTVCAVNYIDEKGFCIDKMLEETPKEQVKGIEYIFLKSGMKTGSSVKLKCKKMNEDEFKQNALRFSPESVKILNYSGKDIYYIDKKVRFVNEDTYNELVNADDYIPSDKYELVLDQENNNEITTIFSCEWFSDGVGYELTGKYIDDMQSIQEYSKELIDYEMNLQQ